MAHLPKIILTLSLFLLLLLPQQSQASLLTDLTPIASYSCDETSGTRADDTTNALDLTDNNTVTYDTGLVGNACLFTAANSEYLSHADDALLEPGSAFSQSYWVKFNSDTDGMLFTKCASGSCSYWTHWAITDIFRYSDSIQTTYDWSGALSTATWYHIVITYSAGTLKFYKDGNYISSYTIENPIPDSTAQFQFGKTQWFNSNYFDGLLDSAALFDYALSATEVTTLYNDGVPLVWDGSTDSGPATSTPSTTPSTSNNGDLVFLLSVIIFFLATIWIGMFVSSFRNRK